MQNFLQKYFKQSILVSPKIVLHTLHISFGNLSKIEKRVWRRHRDIERDIEEENPTTRTPTYLSALKAYFDVRDNNTQFWIFRRSFSILALSRPRNLVGRLPVHIFRIMRFS